MNNDHVRPSDQPTVGPRVAVSLEQEVLTTQQALPRSAIFTCSLSAFRGSRGFTSRLQEEPVEGDTGRRTGGDGEFNVHNHLKTRRKTIGLDLPF